MNCKIKRRMWITHGSMFLDGSDPEYLHSEWVEEECGTPIFSNDKTRVVCASCLKGWSHQENFMLDTAENRRLLSEAKKAADMESNGFH